MSISYPEKVREELSKLISKLTAIQESSDEILLSQINGNKSDCLMCLCCDEYYTNLSLPCPFTMDNFKEVVTINPEIATNWLQQNPPNNLKFKLWRGKLIEPLPKIKADRIIKINDYITSIGNTSNIFGIFRYENENFEALFLVEGDIMEQSIIVSSFLITPDRICTLYEGLETNLDGDTEDYFLM